MCMCMCVLFSQHELSATFLFGMQVASTSVHKQISNRIMFHTSPAIHTTKHTFKRFFFFTLCTRLRIDLLHFVPTHDGAKVHHASKCTQHDHC